MFLVFRAEFAVILHRSNIDLTTIMIKTATAFFSHVYLEFFGADCFEHSNIQYNS